MDESQKFLQIDDLRFIDGGADYIIKGDDEKYLTLSDIIEANNNEENKTYYWVPRVGEYYTDDEILNRSYTEQLICRGSDIPDSIHGLDLKIKMEILNRSTKTPATNLKNCRFIIIYQGKKYKIYEIIDTEKEYSINICDKSKIENKIPFENLIEKDYISVQLVFKNGGKSIGIDESTLHLDDVPDVVIKITDENIISGEIGVSIVGDYYCEDCPNENVCTEEECEVVDPCDDYGFEECNPDYCEGIEI